MEKFRLKTYVQVEVNDNGDTIKVYVADMDYKRRFNSVLQEFNEISETLYSDEILKLSDEERTQYMIDKMKNVVRKIDDIFGKDCCRKVFGDIIPSPDYVADFFKEIAKVIQKYDLERKKELAMRYSESRKGAESDV